MKTKLYTLLILFCSSFIGYAQTGIGIYSAVDGGFENQTTGNLTNTTLLTNAWTTNTNGAGNLRTITASGGRSGPKYVTFGLNGSSTSTATKYYYSSQLPGAFAANTKYQIQFYCRATSGSTTTNVNMYVDNSTTAFPGTIGRQGVSAALGTVAITDWTKKTYEITTNATTPLTNGLVGFSITPIATTAYSVDFDDYVVYKGELDIDAPTSPGAITATGVTAGATVSWAAAADVDGGGYVVVRYAATLPLASDDPLQNGIYAKGNIIGAGEVRYIGAATSFADTGLSPGVDYYYKVYTVDKAFNYSAESVSTAVQSLATTYYYKGTTAGIGGLTDLANWGLNTDGTGTAPANFTDASQVFEIRNTTAVALDGAWVVGASNGTKVRLGNAAAVTLTLNSGASIGPSASGNFDVLDPSSGNHTVIYKGTTLISFGNIFDADLEVIYDGVTVSTSSTKSFGTVSIINGANVTFTTNPIIKNMNVDAASTLVAPNNTANYITIPDGGSVTINGTVRVPKLTGFVSSGVTPSSAGGDIQFIGTENLTLGTNSTVEYIRDASSNQNITSRTDYKNMTLGGTVQKTISGTTTVAGTLIINTGNKLTINEGMVLTVSGTITNNGDLVLKSSATGTASLLSTPSVANVTVERYLSSNQRGWRFLSNPLNTKTFNTLATTSNITIGTNYTGEYLSASNTWTSTDGTASMDTQKAYKLFITGLSGESPTYTTGPSNVTISYKGTAANTEPSSIITALGQYYLVANPYTAPVSLSAIIGASTGLSNTVSYYDPTLASTDEKVKAGGYNTVPVSGLAGSSTDVVIPVMGAVFVQASSAGTINIPKAAIFTGAPLQAGTYNYKTAQTKDATATTLKVVVSSGSTYYDSLNLQFKTVGDAGSNIDFGKLPNTILDFYSINGSTNMAASELELKDQIIPLGIISTIQKSYTLNVAENNIPAGFEAELIDNVLGTITVLTPGTNYNFAIDSTPATQGNARFAINLKTAGTLSVATNALDSKIQLWPNPAQNQFNILNSNDSESSIEISTINGQVIHSQKLNPGITSIPTNVWSAGLYILKATNNGAQTIKKLIIEK